MTKYPQNFQNNQNILESTKYHVNLQNNKNTIKIFK